ncbi:portal protein [Lentilitoribacter sp. Alg239-R112]|uniref:portal protein n=1 Tax=Lentilitoribacter sp. Alg239-R112 TaxID=2305987 RepID=UPI0013A6ED54|nr:portal protein [Lentilitoribacter sp. Alg239-R112]
MDKKQTSKKEDKLTFNRDRFEIAKSALSDNHDMGLQDLRFAKLGEQWPAEIVNKRKADGRPVLTINKMQTFIRQVVNDARQNKPSIKVKAVDSSADTKTAQVYDGLIRNIEYTSNADIAYDTAVECAVTNGFGYIRVGIDYSYEDAFDMDINIDRVINPFAIYPDPNATCADGSSWNECFVVDRLSKTAFKDKYQDAEVTDFDDDKWSEADGDWVNDDGVLVAEFWQRKEVDQEIVLTSDGRVFSKEDLLEDIDLQTALEAGTIKIVKERVTKSYKVTQTIMTGAEILEENDWAGKYIPIVPVYGDEFSVEGKRYFRSLINPAKDAQRQFNYWRTTATELVALAPRAPYIGPHGAFDTDVDKWQTAHKDNHAYLEYDGEQPPQRQPIDSGAAGGALQEALNASDDIKSTIGMYDASLGARSNETSGKAIMARQREGDVATFHFTDNLTRAIRQVGRIVVDLIPSVYNKPRILRVLGEDGKEHLQPVNQGQEVPHVGRDGKPEQDDNGEIVLAMHDLTVGKYDVAVEAGPSFTTRREEAAAQMTEMIRSFPQAAPVLGAPLAKNMDWPQADEIAEKLTKLDPTNDNKLPPEVQKLMAQGKQQIQQLTQENQKLEQQAAQDIGKAQVEMAKIELEREKIELEREKMRLEEKKLAFDAVEDVTAPI